MGIILRAVAPAAQGLGDATPRANAPELRAFLPRRLSAWNPETAWLGDLDSNPD